MSHSEAYAQLIRQQDELHERLLAQNETLRGELGRLKGLTLKVGDETRALEVAA